MDNGTIDLKKLKKTLPPPPVPVAPLGAGLPSRPMVTPPTPPPASRPSISSAPTMPSYTRAPKRGVLARYGIPFIGFNMPTIVGVIVLLAVLFGGYYIYKNFWTKSPFGPTAADAQAAAATSTSSSAMSESEIIAAVGKIMLLPNDDTPTLAKVSDPSVLQSQTFFKNAAVGDVVLMYSKSMRAIIYDPSQNKIIEVGPITGASASTTAAATSTRS